MQHMHGRGNEVSQRADTAGEYPGIPYDGRVDEGRW